MQKQKVSDPADPNRCQGTGRGGQCPNVAEPGSLYCHDHGGRDSGAEKRTYLLARAKYRERLAQLSDDDNLKSLREEIALIRILIEERFNMIKSDSDAMLHFTAINTALLTVERLQSSLHKMEERLGTLLSKATVVKLGQSISRILVEELRGVEGYEVIVDRVNERIVQTIDGATNEEDSK